MKPDTHLAIDHRLGGQLTEQSRGRSVVTLELTVEMRVDERGLVHGGFIFGAADYAAMMAVNEPFVVLVSASVSFARPSRVGDSLVFEAVAEDAAAKRRVVSVTGRRGDGEIVFSGTFSCAVPQTHVLDRR